MKKAEMHMYDVVMVTYDNNKWPVTEDTLERYFNKADAIEAARSYRTNNIEVREYEDLNILIDAEDYQEFNNYFGNYNTIDYSEEA